MANRVKEDEKNEKIIRGLLKLPANRRCINCNSLGPQYVCTNFWTFICTNCSGLHREFTHRVKSISMAKFTSQEVSALQEGGNERAREIYFKEWDPQRQTAPDSSNLDRLRDFIKHVYVDRRFSGERSVDRPPRAKGEREDYYENRREDSNRGGSRSPPYDDTYERRNNDRPGSGGRNDERKFRSGYGERSPGYDQDDYRRSPGRFEVVDEKWRGDKPANGNQNRRFEDRGLPDGVPRPEERSPNNQKDATASSPPAIRPVSDVLGADVPPLRVGGPPKLNGIKPPNGSVQAQTVGSSSSRGSSDSLELKKVNFESLIDFDADPEPSVGGAPHQSAPQQAGAPDNGGNWASFDVPSKQTAPRMASHAGNLESALAQLSAPVSAPAVSISMLPVAGGQWPGVQLPQQVSQFQTADSRATNPPLTAPIVGIQNNQSWGPSAVPNMQVPLTAPSAQSSQAVTRPPHVMNVAGLSQPPVEAKSGVRKELPQDLFAALYSSTPAPVSSWQTGTNLGIGYGMQYPTVAAIPTFPQPSVSKNPFDFGNEASVTHAPAFPSMASLHGALPNVNNPSASLHTSSYGAPSQWMLPQPSSFPSSASASPYMVQQQHPSSTPQQVLNNFFLMGHQGAGGFSSQGTPFGSSPFNQHSVARNSQMGLPNSFVPSVGRNPFG